MTKINRVLLALLCLCSVAAAQTLNGLPDLSLVATANQFATLQSVVSALQTSVQTANASANTALANSSTALGSIPLSDYIGVYSLSTLPPANGNSGKRVLVTDLGGGPGYLRSSGGCWKRVSTTTASVQTVNLATAVTIDGLSMSPIINLAGSSFAAKSTITLTNACSMPQITVVSPTGIFGALGSLGLSIPGGSAISVSGIGVTGTWNDYAVSSDGLTLTKIRGGSL